MQSMSPKRDQAGLRALTRVEKQQLPDDSDRRPSLGEVGRGGGLGGRLESVLDQGLEDVDVLEEPAATLVGDPAKGLRAILVEPFPDLDEAGLVEDLEMTAEVAVGQVAQLLEVREDDAARIGDQRGHDAEPGLLVEDSLQALVSKAARRFLWSGFRRRHGPAPGSGKARQRQAVAPRRREGPWPRGSERAGLASEPASPTRSSGRRPPRRTWTGVEAGRRRRCPGCRAPARVQARSRRSPARNGPRPSSPVLPPPGRDRTAPWPGRSARESAARSHSAPARPSPEPPTSR